MTIWISVQAGCGQYHKKAVGISFIYNLIMIINLQNLRMSSWGEEDAIAAGLKVCTHIFMVKVGLVEVSFHLASHSSLPY